MYMPFKFVTIVLKKYTTWGFKLKKSSLSMKKELSKSVTLIGLYHGSHTAKEYERIVNWSARWQFMSQNIQIFCGLTIFVSYSILARVDMVGTNHNKILTQWRHMLMGQFCANIFLIQITSTYFWASEVFKNRSSKSWLFWLSGWNIWKTFVN